MKKVTPPGTFDRTSALARLTSERFDLAVIGAGVTGAGVALDAASRGLKTALIEKGDFASGTSSKSSKLVHGGLRYLEQREFGLVYESLHERQRLLDNAPHLVEPQPFLIPLFGKGGVVDATIARTYSLALWLYDMTGGIRIGKRHKRISCAEAAAHMPTLRADRLAAGFIYYDARVDDARLALALARTAVIDHGAVAASYVRAGGLAKDASGRITGVEIDGPGVDEGSVVEALSVVNATGVWADEVRQLDEGSDPASIRPAKGIHVTVAHEKLPCDIAAVIPVRKDHRSIFVIPWAWGGQTYIGTTDTDYRGPLDDPECTPADVAYLLDAVNDYVSEPLTVADVTGTWAGLRPLVASGKRSRSARTADLSRRHFISASPTGMVTVTGGKLTTYRKMASDTVDTVIDVLGHRRLRCRTKNMRLRGAAGLDQLTAPGASERWGTTREVLDHLARRYGSESVAILDLCRDRPDLARQLVPGTPYLSAEAVFAVRAEMAQTLEDVLTRRTRALLLEHRATVDAAPTVADLMAGELGWDTAERDRQVKEFLDLADRLASAAGLPMGARPSEPSEVPASADLSMGDPR